MSEIDDRPQTTPISPAIGDAIFTAIPYVVGITGIAGVVIALVLRSRSPRRFDRLGRVVLDEER